MAEFDPMDELTQTRDQPVPPDPEFAERLRAQLLADLDLVPGKSSDHTSIDVQRSPEERRRAPSLALAALAVAAAFLIGIVVFNREAERSPVVTDTPTTSTSVPESPSTSTTLQPPEIDTPIQVFSNDTDLTIETARALLAAIGSEDGMVVNAFDNDHPWNAVTFDPLDRRRVLLADLRFDANAPAHLWTVTTDAAEPATLPWIDEQLSTRGGLFQRDGSIVVDPAQLQTPGLTHFPVLNGDGTLRAKVDAGIFAGSFTAAEGERTISLASRSFTQCPFTSVHIGTPDGTTEVNTTDNAFARVDIIEPGVGVAFPHIPISTECPDTDGQVARAWDLQTAEPLPDHVLDGMPIARAAMSGDGTRTIVLSVDGTVQVLDARSADTISEFAETVNVAPQVVPLALNNNGTLAAIAEDGGRLSVWHVATGERLLELTGDTRTLRDSTGALDVMETMFDGVAYQLGASLSYDASRVALLDQSGDELGRIRIFTLDPHEWLIRACDAGFTMSSEDRRAQGLDPSLPCS